MAETRVALPYDQGTMVFSLSDGWSVDHAEVKPLPETQEFEETVRAALRRPVEGSPLRERARPGMRVTIAVTDSTRPCPDAVLLALMLEDLRQAGVRDDDVTVLIALGMHRQATEQELKTKLGDLFGRVRVEQAQGTEQEQYVSLGTITLEGEPSLPSIPVFLHPRIMAGDLLIATGLVEPHQYAGFSGGGKTVVIGCAGEGTIRTLHGIPFLEHPGTCVGNLEGNPLRRVIAEVSERCRLSFVCNVGVDGGGRRHVAAGPSEAVLRALVSEIAPRTWVPVGEEPYDLVLAGVERAKGTNLYQASRAFTYLTITPRPVLRNGGWVVIPAPCDEGAGQGPGEQEFQEALQCGKSPEAVLEHLKRSGFGAGGQRAVLMARALSRYRLMVVGAREPKNLAGFHVDQARDSREAMRCLRQELGERCRTLVVPRALTTLPHPGGGAGEG